MYRSACPKLQPERYQGEQRYKTQAASRQRADTQIIRVAPRRPIKMMDLPRYFI